MQILLSKFVFGFIMVNFSTSEFYFVDQNSLSKITTKEIIASGSKHNKNNQLSKVKIQKFEVQQSVLISYYSNTKRSIVIPWKDLMSEFLIYFFIN